MGKPLLLQILSYAYRPRCLFELPCYVFAQWFKKEAIPKAVQQKKRKLNAIEGEESDKEEEPQPRAETGPTEGTSADVQIAQTNVINELPPLTTGNLNPEGTAAPRKQLPQDSTLISREDIREIMSPDGRDTRSSFQEHHPQHDTHHLVLNVSRHIPVLNGARTSGVEAVRHLVNLSQLAVASATDAEESIVLPTSSTTLTPGAAERALANEFALQILALHKPWDGDGQNILDLEVNDDSADDRSTRTIRMTSFSECLLKWYDAQGGTAIPLHTRRVLDHHQNYYDLKKIASTMASARRKQDRVKLGLPPTNESARRMYADAADEDFDDFEDDAGPAEGASLRTVITPGEPRQLDRAARAMLNSLHIGTF